MSEMWKYAVDRSFVAPKVAVELRTIDFHAPFEGLVDHNDRCLLDFALASRPAAQARYRDLWSPARSEAIGDIFFVPAGMTVQASCDPGRQQSLTFTFDPELFDLDIEQLDDRALAESLHVQNRAVRRNLLRILRELTTPTMGSPLAIEACATVLAVDVARHLSSCPAPGRKTGGLSRAQMRILEERIHADQPLPTVTELAEAAGVSARHLARAFQQETGRTLGEYVTAAGVERARQLLTKTDAPIKQIAAALGFSSSASFAFAFRRSTGLRPRDVRREPLRAA